MARLRTLYAKNGSQKRKSLAQDPSLKFAGLQFPAQKLRIHLAAGKLELIHDGMQPRQLCDQVREQVFSSSAQVNELYASPGTAANRFDLTHGTERSCVDAHDDFRPHAAIKRMREIKAAAVEAQVADRPRQNDAVGRKAIDLRLATARESRAAAAIFFGVTALRHVYKIVFRAETPEHGIKVTQNSEPR